MTQLNTETPIESLPTVVQPDEVVAANKPEMSGIAELTAEVALPDEADQPALTALPHESKDSLNKDFFIVNGIRFGAATVLAVFFMKLFGGPGTTCATKTLSLNYACSINYLWLIAAGLASFAALEFIISKIFKRKFGYALLVAGFTLATLTFFQVSQVFAGLSGSHEQIPSATAYKVTAALVTAIVTALGIAFSHYVRSKKILSKVSVALPVLAGVCLLMLPFLITQHFTHVTITEKAKIAQAGKAQIRQTAKSAATAGFDLYAPRNYTGPLQIKYAKLYFNANDYPRYMLIYQLPTSKSLEMIVHKKDATNNPPINCGDFLPYSIKPNTNLSSLAFPCKLILTTAQGRKVYGFYDSSITDTLSINSADILKYQPSAYYIFMDSSVISFYDSSASASASTASIITPDVLSTFVDSLQSYRGTELQDFVDKYGV